MKHCKTCQYYMMANKRIGICTNSKLIYNVKSSHDCCENYKKEEKNGKALHS